MRVLVTGGSGQLAACLRKTAPAGFQGVYADKAQLNLESESAVAGYLDANPVAAVINCAAYTKVDQAEKEPDRAFAANDTAVRHLGRICRDRKILLVHISTDFLFHGALNRPIDETQAISPIGVYAESKAAGENALREEGVPAVVIRTSWLYSEFGANFMKTMLRLGTEKEKLTVIADQHGSPTYAVDLARGIWQVLKEKNRVAQLGKDLLFYHFCNFGVTTWYDFSTAILGIAGIRTPVEPILTHEYPVATPRPAYSALWPKKFARDFNFPLRHYRSALVEAIGAYKQREGLI